MQTLDPTLPADGSGAGARRECVGEGAGGGGEDYSAYGLVKKAFFDWMLVASDLLSSRNICHILWIAYASIQSNNNTRSELCLTQLSVSATARKIARPLFSVSCHSFSGTESATMPPPAWIYSVLSRMTAVRIAIAVSILLPQDR